MALEENLAEFFDTGDFAVDATYNGASTIPVIKDRRYAEELGIVGLSEVALCQASSVDADPTEKTLVISGVSYTIKNCKALGDGAILALVLEPV